MSNQELNSKLEEIINEEFSIASDENEERFRAIVISALIEKISVESENAFIDLYNKIDRIYDSVVAADEIVAGELIAKSDDNNIKLLDIFEDFLSVKDHVNNIFELYRLHKELEDPALTDYETSINYVNQATTSLDEAGNIIEGIGEKFGSIGMILSNAITAIVDFATDILEWGSKIVIKYSDEKWKQKWQQDAILYKAKHETPLTINACLDIAFNEYWEEEVNANAKYKYLKIKSMLYVLEEFKSVFLSFLDEDEYNDTYNKLKNQYTHTFYLVDEWLGELYTQNEVYQTLDDFFADIIGENTESSYFYLSTRNTRVHVTQGDGSLVLCKQIKTKH